MSSVSFLIQKTVYEFHDFSQYFNVVLGVQLSTPKFKSQNCRFNVLENNNKNSCSIFLREKVLFNGLIFIRVYSIGSDHEKKMSDVINSC